MKPQPRSKRPSMKDVADLAGVSRTTVSFILNRKPDANIPVPTQEKVWAAVKQLGYRPNALARGLRAQRTHTFGFIADEISTTPFAVEILLGAQDLAWEHDTLLFSINTGGKEDLKKAAVDTLLDRQVDGIIYATMWHRQANPPPQLREVPAVLLDCFVEDRSLPSVVPDEVQGGYTAVETLLKKGHRRIGFANDFNPTSAAKGRLEGFKRALATYDVPFSEELVRSGVGMQPGGYQTTMELMHLPDPPTAIFFYNDQMAMGAYHALRELNLSVPDDVAVVGFDDLELIAAHLQPGLTTVALPHYAMGQWAVEHLLDLVNTQEQATDPVQHLMPCPLVERESV